jgi:phage nucleotide-binding protein
MPPVKHRSRPQRSVRDRASTSASTNRLTATKHHVFCIYGDPGIGKTRLIGTLPGKVLLIRSPVDHIDSILTAGLGSNIEERVVSDWNTMNDDLLPEIRQSGSKWDWIVIDSWSLLQDVLMDDIWDVVTTERPERLRYGLDKQEHGINQLRMGVWMRHVVGADVANIIWTSHAQTLPSPDLDEEGDPLEKLMPFIHGGKGAMATKFCGYSKFVGILVKDGKGQRVLHTESNEVFYAKNQFSPNGKDWAIVDPTMPQILSRISKGNTSSKSTKARARKRRAAAK